MKGLILQCSVILFCFNVAVGQHNTIDSLEKLLRVSADNTNKVNILNKLSYEYLYSYHSKAIFCNKQALELSQKLNYNKGIASSYSSMGNTYYSTSEYDNALKYYYLSLGIAKKYNYPKIKLAASNGIACVYFADKDYVKAKQIYLEQLRLYGKEISKTILFDYYNNLAACYGDLNKVDSGIYYYNQALILAQKSNSIDKTILTKINIASTYKLKYEISKALSLHLENLKLAKEARKSYYFALINLRISEIYNDLKNDAKAMKYCKVSIRVSDSMHYSEIRLPALKVLANIYLRMNNSQEVYKNLSAYISLKDSILNDQKNRKIAELNTRFETKKKEDDILALQENLRNKKRFLFLVISLSVFLILTLALSLVALRLRQRNQLKEEKLKHQETILLEQKLEIKSNVEKELKMELENKMNEIKNNLLSIIKLKNQKENLIDDFRKIKDYLNPDGVQIFTSINNLHKIDNLQLKISEFESNFEEINKGFYESLLKLHPDITPNEKKLCAYIALGMSTIEISELTFQSENSIYVSRNRLKKKLNTVDQSMEDYLKTLISYNSQEV